MRKATFEVATLADAINKASRIAPSKGAGFDRAAGIVLEIDPTNTEEPVVVKATDLNLTFRQSVNMLELGDEKANWRVSSSLLNSILSTLPMSTGSTIVLADNGDGYLYFKSGKTKAKLRLIVGDFPVVGMLDPETFVTAANFARRMQQVAWACDKNRANVLGGIHISGTHLYGCDRQVAARVPCPVPLVNPATAPLAELSALIKNTSEVAMRATESHLYLMPDQYTQMSSVMFSDGYPNVNGLFAQEKYTNSAKISVDLFRAALDRMLILVKSERMPVTTIEIGDQIMSLAMEVPEVGRISDEIPIEGGSQGEPFQVSFTPTAVMNALDVSGRPFIHLDYGPTPLSQMRLRDDNDFVVVIMPRRILPGGT